MSESTWPLCVLSRRLLLVSIVFSAFGCTVLQPLELPEEQALAPSDAGFWRQLQTLRDDEWFYLLNSGEEALDWRLRMIDAATSSVDLDTFLWKPDSSGMAVFVRLLAAADRGVRVRILLDDSFTMHEDLLLHALDEHPQISLRIYNPFRHRSDSAVMRQLLNLGDFPRINHRMHNKTMVVDGRLTLVGGRNLADEYFGLHEQMNFRDMEVIAAGPTVASASTAFDAFWNSGWAFPIGELVEKPAGDRGLAGLRHDFGGVDRLSQVPNFVHGPWQTLVENALVGRAEFISDQPADHNPAQQSERPDQLAQQLRSLIERAESEVVLVTAYLVPTEALETVVEAVEARGVEVRVLTNSLASNNHVAAHAAYRDHLRRLLRHGAQLHEVKVDAANRNLYMSEPVTEKKLGLHAKVLLVDDETVYIGSSNLDPRSLRLNTEVGLVIRGRAFSERIRRDLAADFELRNAWMVELEDSGDLRWVSDQQVLEHQPAESLFQRLEDWLIGLLPIDSQM